LARRHLAVVVLVAAVVVLCFIDQRDGHNWGDDFALYINQARALVEGNVGSVISDTRFSLQGSSWHTFSPLTYPWGFPILLAPVVAVWGIESEMLTVVPTLTFAGFLLVFYALVHRRTGRLGAFSITALIAISPSFFGWTDNILSEMPFLFFATLTLWWLERCKERGLYEYGPLRPLVVLGVLIAFTFNIRREGLALVAALVVSDLLLLWSRRRDREGARSVSWHRLRLPYLSALATVTAMQVLLPTVLLPRYPDAGFHNISGNVIWFRDTLAEHIGLKRLGPTALEYFSNGTAAFVLLSVFCLLVILGIVMRVVNHLQEDAAILTFMVATAVIVGMQPFHEGRYLMSVSPFMIYFAYQAIASTGRDLLFPGASPRARAAPGIAAAVVIGVFIAGHVVPVYDRVSYRLEYTYAHGGPDHPAAQEMFQAVRDHTRGDAVVAFFRARAMNLYTERRSLQLTRVDQITQRADWYAMQKDSTYSQVLVSPEEGAEHGWTVEWENDHWVLWRIPRS
jgi:4-amino-4-deoxy-L-arabinose transferase-like glycosyltransferase